MSSLFDIDGGFMGALGKVADVMLLSLIFFVFSIPVFTIGASSTALYYTSVKVIRRGRSYIWQSFWKSFKQNFKKATVFWLAILLMTGILCLNIWYANQIGGTVWFVLLCIYSMMLILILLITAYIFPILSRFEMTWKNIVKNSLFMAIRHLPFSILMVAILAVILVLTAFFPPAIFFIPASGAIVYSLPMEKILKKYTQSSGNEDADEWYME